MKITLSVHKWLETPFSLLVSHPTVSRLLSSPNIQSGKYNEMDPILIGTAVSEHVIKEMSKPAVPLVKVLWRTIISSIFMITNGENKRVQHPRWLIEFTPKCFKLTW